MAGAHWGQGWWTARPLKQKGIRKFMWVHFRSLIGMTGKALHQETEKSSVTGSSVQLSLGIWTTAWKPKGVESRLLKGGCSQQFWSRHNGSNVSHASAATDESKRNMEQKVFPSFPYPGETASLMSFRNYLASLCDYYFTYRLPYIIVGWGKNIKTWL